MNEMNKMDNNKRLLNLVDKIKKENILSKKQFKMKVAPVLVQNNDSRKIEGLISNLYEGDVEDIKDQDVDNLIILLQEYCENIEFVVEDVSNIENTENTENNKLMELYNNSLAKIKELEKDIETKTKLEEKLEQIERKLKEFESLNIDKIMEENKLYSEMFKITGNQLIEVPDEDIDALYIRYKIHGIKKYGKAFVTGDEVIPKAYYDIKGGK